MIGPSRSEVGQAFQPGKPDLHSGPPAAGEAGHRRPQAGNSFESKIFCATETDFLLTI
jgi:hypothetical protein